MTAYTFERPQSEPTTVARVCLPWRTDGLRHQCVGHDQTVSCRCGCGELRPLDKEHP